MNIKLKDRKFTLSGLSVIVAGTVAVTLSLSPWVNSDSLIIPKGIILVCLSAYIFPKFIHNVLNTKKTKGLKLLNILATLFIVQMVLVMLITSAPFEQQFFGRTGRGLGFATYLALTVLLLTTAYSALESKGSQKIIIGLVVACVISSFYSVLQRFGYDIFDWVTYTNGIIGTLGNPNFQSSFVAMAIVPSLVMFKNYRKYILLKIILVSFLIFTLYLCESTQGYVASVAAIFSFFSIYIWYKRKIYIYPVAIIAATLGLISVFGMLNKGPLSLYFYKSSVISRGEMLVTGLNTIADNPFFGVGLDSFGDFSLMYRELPKPNGINEYTDNVHNLFLQFGVTGGVLLSIIYLIIMVFALRSFYVVQKRFGKFDSEIAAIFSSWLCFQLQSLISPANISMLAWNFLITGFIIGYANSIQETVDIRVRRRLATLDITRPIGILSLIISFAFMYPWYNSDRIAWAAYQTRNTNALVQSTELYPKSTVRYIRIGVALYDANLLNESLIVAKSAIQFNPGSVQGWLLILINPSASIEERLLAKERILKLDPYNKTVTEIKL